MRISERGLTLIKKYEGCRLTAYKCPAGVWTIGWGHTGDVVSGQTITQEQADQMLRDDMGSYERAVEKYNDTYHWTQNEFDALTSFAYNVGSIDQLTASGTRDKATIAEKMLLYTKAGGKELAGLVKRRKEERELYLTREIPPQGWYQDEQGWRYYTDDQGNCVTEDWYQDGDKWYWFGDDGYMLSGSWLRYKGKWYYLGDDGAMLTGLQIINGKCYYFNKDGDMTTEPVTLVPDEDGALY